MQTKKEIKLISTGVKCPECGLGEIVERKTHKNKVFYSCENFPDCKYALWYKPTGEKCFVCGAMLTVTPKGTQKCSNKKCISAGSRKKAVKK